MKPESLPSDIRIVKPGEWFPAAYLMPDGKLYTSTREPRHSALDILLFQPGLLDKNGAIRVGWNARGRAGGPEVYAEIGSMPTDTQLRVLRELEQDSQQSRGEFRWELLSLFGFRKTGWKSDSGQGVVNLRRALDAANRPKQKNPKLLNWPILAFGEHRKKIEFLQ